ncbi:LacI family DNA-binding transcriptional regulator [Grimontia hollisae]|uniref:LacI family DNA-binding transcriptional regulator n=1 Tax=Grimontia hollisae TaxID=673 RepID=UPI0006805981|nr:LacI family DNA-binding transcriptional regulator [Grimontia hollisae]AMG30848.1 LacI family DNA-binding transcriptional regulator [Grimontia hollisae]STO47273.1 Gluconate utilization system GNT-I transcriptional repressor [Grimontia hollisae]
MEKYEENQSLNRTPRKRRSTGRATITDVAKLAGVGTMTVSRALRTPDQVSEKLRIRINEAVNELGYIPNKAAGSLASVKSNSIAVILPSFTEKACSEFLIAFQDVVRTAEYQVFTGYNNFDVEREAELLTAMLENNPAAVVLFGSERLEHSRKQLEAAKIPVIEVNERIPDAVDLNIGVSHYDAAKAMTLHLVGKGYKNIGFVGARAEQSVLQQQLSGWQAGMIESYLTPDHFITTHENPSMQLGRDAMNRLRLRQPELDALVCSHESIALGVLFECHKQVVRVPHALAVSCLDGSESCEECYPSLTSINVDYTEMGKKAAHLLLARLNGQTLDDDLETLTFTLIARNSS